MAKHPLDIAAERLEALADSPVVDAISSQHFWELRTDCDAVGDLPQTTPCDETIPFCWDNSEGLGNDGFPTVPFPDQRLKNTAKKTDVINCSLPASWSDGHVFNERAAELLRRFDLGNIREYSAKIFDGSGAEYEYTYFHVRNVVAPDSFDFNRSEFYLAEMLGTPKASVDINSFKEWQEKSALARTGKLNNCEQFSKIALKELYFKDGFEPTTDYFTLEKMSIATYVSAKLRNAILESGITGLELKANKRLFSAKIT